LRGNALCGAHRPKHRAAQVRGPRFLSSVTSLATATSSSARRRRTNATRDNSGHGAVRPEPGLKCLFEMERTGIEPVASDLQIPGSSVELGQIRSISVTLRR